MTTVIVIITPKREKNIAFLIQKPNSWELYLPIDIIK